MYFILVAIGFGELPIPARACSLTFPGLGNTLIRKIDSLFGVHWCQVDIISWEGDSFVGRLKTSSKRIEINVALNSPNFINIA